MKKNDFDRLIGENIRQYREKAYLAQAQLRRLSFISRIERGEKSMKLQTLHSIAGALDASCDALLQPEITVDPHITTIVCMLKDQSPSYMEGIEAMIRTCDKHFKAKYDLPLNIEKMT